MIQIVDNTKTGRHRTPVNTVEEGFELLQVAEQVDQIVSSELWENGRMVGFWERGKNVVDHRSPA